MPFCPDVFSACLHISQSCSCCWAVLWCFALRYWTVCKCQGSFQILQEISAVQATPHIAERIDYSLKGGLKPVLHEDLHYSLSWRGISSFLFFPRVLFCLNGTSHFYLLAVSIFYLLIFFHMQKACLKWARISVPVLLTLDSGLRVSRLKTLMSVAMRNKLKV